MTRYVTHDGADVVCCLVLIGCKSSRRSLLIEPCTRCMHAASYFFSSPFFSASFFLHFLARVCFHTVPDHDCGRWHRCLTNPNKHGAVGTRSRVWFATVRRRRMQHDGALSPGEFGRDENGRLPVGSLGKFRAPPSVVQRARTHSRHGLLVSRGLDAVCPALHV